MEKLFESRVNSPFLPCGFGRMYVQWREREHEAANELVQADPNVMAVLTVGHYNCLIDSNNQVIHKLSTEGSLLFQI
jgi:hypothetical protein